MVKFIDRYNEDKEYRVKHLQYMQEKVECGCGKTLSRSYMSGHRQTRAHQNWLSSKKPEIVKIKKRIAELQKYEDELKRLRKKLRTLK